MNLELCKGVYCVDLGLLGKFSFDTAENEPCKVYPLSVYRLLLLQIAITDRPGSGAGTPDRRASRHAARPSSTVVVQRPHLRATHSYASVQVRVCGARVHNTKRYNKLGLTIN